MKRFVEEKLPRGWLYELGVYVQTCAQIEFYACRAICFLDDLAEGSEDWHNRLNCLRRMPTQRLITTLSNAAKRYMIGDPWAAYFKELAGHLHRFVENRHLAIHGRHIMVGQTVYLDAAEKGSRQDRIFDVSSELVREATEDADRILRALVRFCEEKSAL
ncbi:hypothetical protein [uncultured Mameliella sp.]|uniref:hypothetical protein n=1 Tax=uncultured Mameliella sp. TaxID=1447087 RepID=UPI0026364196|nr:hypothetical protein [uncultured Mameliella sp.]